MIIYKCILCNNEMFSDTFKVKESESGIFYEVEGKVVTRVEGFDDNLIAANASSEETVESVNSNTFSGVDIVLNHSLQETSFDKKQYRTYIKEYLKKIKAKLEESNPERVESFMSAVQPEVKRILENFSSYQFFTGESMDPDASVGLLDYREDGVTPYMIFFKDGLVVEKC